jgi:hypothetical protein
MKKNKYYIEYLNKDKKFIRDKKEFKTFEDACEWCKKNLGNFNTDMIQTN